MPDPQDAIKTARVPDDLTGLTVGRFFIEGRIGAGGMGQVYRAEDTTLKRVVAVKRMAPHLALSDSDRHRFLKEAQRASALNHPNIAAVHDVIEFHGELFLVMEFIEGTTLRQRLRGQAFGAAEFMQIAIQCSEGLSAAHQRGIVHGDIKPENIMLTPSQRVKILDFGVARKFASDPMEATQTLVTMNNATSGTPAYMAPEVLKQLPHDGRADLFSLGLVLYELLGGDQPFATDSFAGTLGRVLHVEPLPIREANPSVPEPVAAIVGKLLKKDPETRYHSADELLDDLRSVQQGGSPKANLEPVIQRSFFAGLAGRVAIAAALLLVFGLMLWKLEPLRRVLGRGSSAATSVAKAPQARILAVLPFVSTEGDAKLAALGQGLVQSVSAKLGRLTEERSLEVIPASNMQDKRVTSFEDARKQFGATLALSINLRQASDLISVSYSLVDTQSGRILGGDSVTVPASDVFAVEDNVAQGTIDALQLQLRPDERAALKMHGTSLPAAYNYYLQARGYLLNFSSPENVDNAIVLAQQALKLDPNFGMAKASLGEAYWRRYWLTKQKRWTQLARAECDEAVKLGNSGAAGHICLGLVHEGTGQYAQAAAEYQRAIELDTTNENAHIGLALALEHQGKPDRAEQIYSAAVENHPQSWTVINSVGGFYFRRNDYQKAAEMFRKVTELAPEGFAGYVNLGGAFNKQGRYNDSVEPLKKSISLRPTYAAYANLGNAYFGLNDFAQAAAAYEEGAKINAQQYAPWGNLGEAHYYAGAKDRAMPAYRKAAELAAEELKVNPHDAEVLSDLANYYSMLGDRKQALLYLEQALRYGRNDKQIYVVAASVYNQLGETGLALEWLTKTLQAGFPATTLQNSPTFRNLASDPRFSELIRAHAGNP